MGIITITTDLPGQIGDIPRRVKIVTTDNLATVTTANYLNNATLQGYTIYKTDVIDMWYGATVGANLQIITAGTFSSFTPTISNGVITLVQAVNPGDVLLPVVSGNLAVFNGTSGQIKDAGITPSASTGTIPIVATPTIANHIATYTNTAGSLGEDAATAINGGNIQAGLSGTAGTLGSFPSAATSGELIVAAVTNSSGNFNTTISNASAVAQSQVISIPDSGSATANFILSKSGGTQHITSGSLEVDAGSLISGLSTGGTVGTLQLFPTTTTTGSLQWQATPNSGNTATIFTTAAYGQASTITFPDPAVASARGVLAPTALVSGNINQASGTAGLIVDAGIAALNVSIMKVFTLTFTQLASAGKVNIQVHPSGTSQYFIQDIKVLTSTGLSGGGGNRLLAVTDGTLVWNNAGITAALLGTPIFTLWGGTGNPIAVSTSQVSTAGADIYFQYTGGTTDYTAGSVQIAVTYVKVTA